MKKPSDEKIKEAAEIAARLSAMNSSRMAKYRRNYNRYNNNGSTSADLWQLDSEGVQGYRTAWAYDNDTGATAQYNVIQSCVDTLVSKITQTKVRPFFNPVNGLYDTRKACKNAQIFFDAFYERKRVYQQAGMALLSAALFDHGAIWIDEQTANVKRLNPWQVHYSHAEYDNGSIKYAFIEFRNYPLNAVKTDVDDLTRELKQNPLAKCDYGIVYNLIDKIRCDFVGGRIAASYGLASDVCPIAVLYYADPIKGANSTGLADRIYATQIMIDRILQRVSDATELTPANTMFVPTVAGVKVSKLSNRIGEIVEYTPAPGASSPVTVATPQFISPQYIDMLDRLVRYAYEQSGISQLSAQSKKPTGISSGVALQTLEDVESERFETVLQNYIRFCMRIAEICIDVLPDDLEVLPRRSVRSDIKWRDVRKQRELFNIQFSAASSLSKDPQTKMGQIEKLISMGMINQDIASSLLDMPDLEGAYSIATTSYDATSAIIDTVINTGDYDLTGIENLPQLLKETANTMMRMIASGEKREALDRLISFTNKIVSATAELSAPPEPPMPQEVPEPQAQMQVVPEQMPIEPPPQLPA